MYKIKEIFYSLQGEGSNAGTPAIFIRFAGCNLACPWCDTNYHYGDQMEVEDIIDKCLELVPKGEFTEKMMVVLTGGEPSLQVDHKLLRELHQEEFYVAIETNGTHEIPDDIDWVTLSPKEGSTLALDYADEVKVVYTGTSPEHWREKIVCHNWFLQPLHNGTSANTEETVKYILNHPDWQLSMQLHKILGLR